MSEAMETDTECVTPITTTTTTTTTTISDLPDEMISYIFTFLSLPRRKRVRRVCRRWYECSTRMPFIEKEKFVFRAGADLGDVAEFMNETGYNLLNLQFKDLPMNELAESAWQACGKRVQSLELCRCQWNDETIKSIIQHCENMLNFAIETPKSMVESEGDVGGFCALLSSMKITRPHLETFTFFTDLTLLRESVLSQLASVFPCIKNLNVAPISRDGRATAYPQRVSAAFDACLNNVHRLDSLKFNLRTNGHWMATLTAKASPGFGLKRLEAVIEYDENMMETLAEFFLSQKQLRIIYLNYKHCDDNKKLKKLVYLMLESCPDLRELYFEYDSGCFHLESWEVSRFVRLTSKLQHLTLGLSELGPNVTPHMFALPKDPRMHILGLIRDSFSVEDEICASLLQHYQSLQHLELCVSSDMLMQKIFEYLPRLRTLLVANVEGCTDFGFIGRDKERQDGFSINRLQHLENLVIGRHSPGVTVNTLLELKLPRLSEVSFRMETFWKLSADELMQLATRMPAVTTFIIDRVGPSEDSFKTFCKYLRRLYFLSCPELLEKTELVAELFNLCPNLRVVTTGRNRRMVYEPESRTFRECKLRCSLKPRIEDRGFWQLR